MYTHNKDLPLCILRSLFGKCQHTSRVLSEDVIQQSVCCKLPDVLRWIFLIQGLQLGLALVELLMVALTTNDF